jgi:hypothetical protein
MKRVSNDAQYTIDVLHHVVVPKSQYAIAIVAQIALTHAIARHVL